jgi:uncharacterized membrane protein YhhN
MTLPFILAGACALWSVFYIWTEYHWPPKKFFFAKAINSLLFLAVGITAFLAAPGNASYAWFILAALMMGLIGDLLLVFSDKLKFFIAGLAAFLVGQLIYTAAFAKYGGFMIYDALIFIALVVFLVIANAKLKLELGRMKKPVAVYAIIISAMFTMAVSLSYKGAFGTAATALIVSGAVLFLASDAVLALVRFKKDRPAFCRGLNLSLYYAAQVLLALSIAFV